MTIQSLDACLELVSDRRRRRIIETLRREVDGTTTVEDLADRLDSRGVPSTADGRQDRTDLVVQLHHVHLPKLANHGLIEFDHERGTVRYRPSERVETVLDSLPYETTVSSS